MTAWQKAIKYAAMAFAIFLCVSIIGGIFSFFSSFSIFFGGKNSVGEMKTYTVNGEITELHINIAASSFVIRNGDDFRVESNLKNLTVEEKNGTLTISEKKRYWGSYGGDVKLELYIPRDIIFDKVDFSSGAGTVDIENLTAESINFELGAGEVKIQNLIVLSKAKLDGGAGKITISGGSLSNLDFNMGVGETSLTSRLSGSCDFDLGIGSTKLRLIGQSDDYAIDVNKGLGEITVDGKKMSDGGVFGEGNNRIKIDGGIGEISVVFQED